MQCEFVKYGVQTVLRKKQPSRIQLLQSSWLQRWIPRNGKTPFAVQRQQRLGFCNHEGCRWRNGEFRKDWIRNQLGAAKAAEEAGVKTYVHLSSAEANSKSWFPYSRHSSNGKTEAAKIDVWRNDLQKNVGKWFSQRDKMVMMMPCNQEVTIAVSLEAISFTSPRHLPFKRAAY